MKTGKKKSQKFARIALVVFALGLLITIIGLSNTIAEISEISVSKTPDAILANAGVSEEKLVSLPVLYFDQKSDDCVNLYDVSLRQALYERQFEWSGCGYYNKEIEQGIVKKQLNEKYLPEAVGGKLTPNRGVQNIESWFDEVEGKSHSYIGALGMQYISNGSKFVFESGDFYPLDEVEFSKDDSVNKDGHNHLFTMNFAVPFTVLGSGEEKFSITADDDTFVFVGNDMVIDMGGVHEATTGEFIIKNSGEIYAKVEGNELEDSGVKVLVGEGAMVRIFHADRDSDESILDMKFEEMDLNVTSAKVAQGDEDVMQIAYDPEDPTYMPPLGETYVFKPDSTKGLVIIATVEGIFVIAVSILLMSVIGFTLKQKIRK